MPAMQQRASKPIIKRLICQGVLVLAMLCAQWASAMHSAAHRSDEPGNYGHSTCVTCIAFADSHGGPTAAVLWTPTLQPKASALVQKIIVVPALAPVKYHFSRGPPHHFSI